MGCVNTQNCIDGQILQNMLGVHMYIAVWLIAKLCIPHIKEGNILNMAILSMQGSTYDRMAHLC